MTIAEAKSRMCDAIGTSRISSRNASTLGPFMTRLTAACRDCVVHDDIGADDVGGHQIGRELDPRERELEALGERLDEERLAEPGYAFEEHVAAGEHSGEHVRDDRAVTDDDLLDLGAQRLERGDELADPGLLIHRGLLSPPRVYAAIIK